MGKYMNKTRMFKYFTNLDQKVKILKILSYWRNPSGFWGLGVKWCPKDNAAKIIFRRRDSYYRIFGVFDRSNISQIWFRSRF